MKELKKKTYLLWLLFLKFECCVGPKPLIVMLSGPRPVLLRASSPTEVHVVAGLDLVVFMLARHSSADTIRKL